MLNGSDKIDYIVENIGAINKTLEFQSQQLQEHIKRTQMLEARLEPIEDHVKFIQGLFKIVVYLAPVCGALAGLLRLLGKI
jgi:hypothetical protein